MDRGRLAAVLRGVSHVVLADDQWTHTTLSTLAAIGETAARRDGDLPTLLAVSSWRSDMSPADRAPARMGEDMLDMLHVVHGLPAVAVRIPNLFGPGLPSLVADFAANMQQAQLDVPPFCAPFMALSDAVPRILALLSVPLAGAGSVDLALVP